MTNEEMFAKIRLGDISFDDFDDWMDEKLKDRYDDGYDNGYYSGVNSYEKE